MKRSQLVQIIKEEIRGYSKYAPGGVTKGGTSKEFMDILTTIAKERPEEDEKYQGDPERGNKILDKANPQNVARITKGDKPIYEEEERQYAKQDVIWYLDRLDPDTQVTIPNINPGGFSRDVGWRTTAAKAKDALSTVKFDGKFELFQDYPNYKHFTLIQSPEELERRSKFMRDFGGLD